MGSQGDQTVLGGASAVLSYRMESVSACPPADTFPLMVLSINTRAQHFPLIPHLSLSWLRGLGLFQAPSTASVHCNSRNSRRLMNCPPAEATSPDPAPAKFLLHGRIHRSAPASLGFISLLTSFHRKIILVDVLH